MNPKSTEKINILFCILNLAHGGTEKQLMTLINGIDRSKFTPHLCCTRSSVIEDSFAEEAHELFRNMKCDKIAIDFKSFRNINSFLWVFKLARYIRKNRIHIVVSYFPDPTIVGFLAARLSFIEPKIVACFRDLGLLRDVQHKMLMKFVYNKTDRFVANSIAVKENYMRFDSIPEKKISVIYNGVDFNKFSISHPKVQNTIVVGLVANLNRKVKRVDIFLHAAALISEIRNDVKFYIIGDGILKGELMNLANKLGLNNKVVFTGRSHNIEKDLKFIDIGVNTSETEGFSNVILEYLASGIPVVATNTGGNREIIIDKKNGFLFPINDHKALRDRLKMILDDYNLYQNLCKNCNKSVKGYFDIPTMVNNYETLFSQTVKG